MPVSSIVKTITPRCCRKLGALVKTITMSSCGLPHTLYPGCNIFVYIADQKQHNTSRARIDCGKLTLFLLSQTLKRGVASQDFAEKHSVPTFMFRHK